MLRALSFARRNQSLSTRRRPFCNKGIKALENEITALCNTRDTVNNIAQIYRESLHRCEYARNKLSWFEKNIPNLSERRTIDSDINWLG